MASNQTVLEDLRKRLSPLSETPYLDAQVLLSEIINRPRSWILAHPEYELTKDENDSLQHALARLKEGQPLPYVLGKQEFYRLTFTITPDVLIPRPETELLVDYALRWLENHPSRRLCADIGTGAGCIGISIAHAITDVQMIANDLSYPALQLAQKNAHQHAVQRRMALFQGDLLQALGVSFDLIAANLPYIPRDRLPSLAVYGREPSLALDGGARGLRIISRLLATAPHHLAKGGLMLCEIDETHGDQARILANKNFPQADIKVEKDLSGLDRLLIIHNENL